MAIDLELCLLRNAIDAQSHAGCIDREGRARRLYTPGGCHERNEAWLALDETSPFEDKVESMVGRPQLRVSLE